MPAATTQPLQPSRGHSYHLRNSTTAKWFGKFPESLNGLSREQQMAEVTVLSELIL